MQDWAAYLDGRQDRSLAELLDLLRIPSISTDTAHAPAVRRAAEWTAGRLKRAGIRGARVMETEGHPAVFGEWLHAPGKPTVLIYGHYDVQPPGLPEAWVSPPFEPAIRNGSVYARGASDMKGNLLLPILACEALLWTTDALPVNVKFLFEGEEEVGSPSLPGFIAANRELLACDMVINADSSQYGEEQPSLLHGMRGVCSLQIDVRSADTDLHSGVMGGIAPNPVHALVRILDSLRSPDGGVLAEGFYADVLPIRPFERELLARLPDDLAEVKRQTGIREAAGEPGYSPRERAWFRPTLDVNGIWGGFQGEGEMTVIPCEAHAKISCRLVPDQKPEQVLDCLKAHIARHAPSEVEVSVSTGDGCAVPYTTPAEHWGMKAAELVLTALYGKSPFHVRSGATVPVTAAFLKLLGVHTLSFGFGLDDEQIHAPNEFLRLSSFRKGQKAFGMLLEELSM